LLVCGTESRGHLAGHSLLAIHANGIDEQGRIIGSQGAIPFIENITIIAVERFQHQVTILDRIGLNDLEEIRKLVKKYKDKGEAYPEEPVVVCSPKKKRSSLSVPTSGDVVISEEFVMDSKAGTIYLAESL
jgi:tetrahydromethanopterin S-methyltransferase subunit A